MMWGTMDGKRYAGLIVGRAAGLALLVVLAGVRMANADAVCGDLDGDGALTRADCTLLLDATLGPPDRPNLCRGAASGARQCGDLNDDDAVDTADAVVCALVIGGQAPPTPLCGGGGAGGTPISCPSWTATVTADITRNQIWPSTCTIVLDGTIFVNANVTLTIQAGTVVKGKKNSSDGSPSALVFRRGAQINAVGTAGAPIVFTSDQAPGARSKGDWGGLALNGRAPVNVPGGEGLAEGLANVPFGGNNADDSSGVMSYVRLEFAGRQLTVDNELNLFTQNGVGAGTTLDHIQAHNGLDDCFEWFGGTVKSKYLVGSACGDDGLDWQLGYTGLVQYGIVAQNLAIVESGGNGIEADNNENGFNLLPRSDPKLCNITLIGTRGQVGTPAGANQDGLLLRRGTAGLVAKAIVEGFHKAGIELQHATPGCSAGPTLTGALLVRDSIFFNNGAGAIHCASGSGGNVPSPCNGCEFYDLLANAYNVVPDLCGVGPLGCQDQNPAVDPTVAQTWPPSDPRPTNATVVASAFDCSSVDAFFDPTSYVGAFEPGGTNWLAGWTIFDVN
jgi:hypothetical protein